MATLHLVRTNNREKFDSFLRYKQEKDSLLLLDDGVYLALNIKPKADFNCFAISEHMVARGIEATHNTPQISAVSLDEMVTLTLKANKVINWS